jgi:hypothetical protein
MRPVHGGGSRSRGTCQVASRMKRIRDTQSATGTSESISNRAVTETAWQWPLDLFNIGRLSFRYLIFPFSFLVTVLEKTLSTTTLVLVVLYSEEFSSKPGTGYT